MSNNFSNGDLDYNNVKKEEELELSKLIFPINVHESLQASSGLKNGEKIGIIVSFWLFGCFILAWFLLGWLRQITTHYILYVFIVEILLQLTIGVYILRYALNERSMLAEVNETNTSFANYFRIYKELKSESNVKYDNDMLEYSDGSYGLFLQLRLGHNTRIRSDNTYFVNRELEAFLARNKLSSKVIYHTESFKNSKASNDLRRPLKNITDQNLFYVYRTVLQNYLDIAEEESNTPCITRIIYASTRIDKDDFNNIANGILDILYKQDTVYREIKFLNYEEIVEFLRSYYCLDVLDMGLVKISSTERKSSTNNSITVVKLYGSSGKNYINEEYNNISKDILSNSGLEQIN